MGVNTKRFHSEGEVWNFGPVPVTKKKAKLAFLAANVESGQSETKDSEGPNDAAGMASENDGADDPPDVRVSEQGALDLTQRRISQIDPREKKVGMENGVEFDERNKEVIPLAPSIPANSAVATVDSQPPSHSSSSCPDVECTSASSVGSQAVGFADCLAESRELEHPSLRVGNPRQDLEVTFPCHSAQSLPKSKGCVTTTTATKTQVSETTRRPVSPIPHQSGMPPAPCLMNGRETTSSVGYPRLLQCKDFPGVQRTKLFNSGHVRALEERSIGDAFGKSFMFFNSGRSASISTAPNPIHALDLAKMPAALGTPPRSLSDKTSAGVPDYMREINTNIPPMPDSPWPFPPETKRHDLPKRTLLPRTETITDPLKVDLPRALSFPVVPTPLRPGRPNYTSVAPHDIIGSSFLLESPIIRAHPPAHISPALYQSTSIPPTTFRAVPLTSELQVRSSSPDRPQDFRTSTRVPSHACGKAGSPERETHPPEANTTKNSVNPDDSVALNGNLDNSKDSPWKGAPENDTTKSPDSSPESPRFEDRDEMEGSPDRSPPGASSTAADGSVEKKKGKSLSFYNR